MVFYKPSGQEIESIVSSTDGKFSLAALDPNGGSGSIVSMLWDLFLVGVIVFFFVSIIDQVGQQKHREVSSGFDTSIHNRFIPSESSQNGQLSVAKSGGTTTPVNTSSEEERTARAKKRRGKKTQAVKSTGTVEEEKAEKAKKEKKKKK